MEDCDASNRAFIAISADLYETLMMIPLPSHANKSHMFSCIIMLQNQKCVSYLVRNFTAESKIQMGVLNFVEILLLHFGHIQCSPKEQSTHTILKNIRNLSDTISLGPKCKM